MSNLATQRLVERRMRTWELGAAQKPPPPPLTTERIHPYVAISRMLGSGGREIADRLGDLLNWPVYDKEILDYMAGDDEVQRRLYESVDERTASWLESMIAPFRAEAPRSRDDYFRKLVRAVRTTASHGSAIFVGRGAGFILPADRGLHVFVTAPIELRIEAYIARESCPRSEAAEAVRASDTSRTTYLCDRFGADTAAAERYDLMVNTGTIPPAEAVGIIAAAGRTKHLTESDPAPPVVRTTAGKPPFRTKARSC